MKNVRLRNWGMLFVGVVIVTMVSGCAFGTRNIALRYETATEMTGTSGESIAIVKFNDIREKPEMGEVRNGYGMKTATVVANDQDVGAWVANALADELTKAGYVIAKYKDAAPPDIKISITGKVNEAYVKMFMSSRATVRASVIVTKAGVVVLNKEYKGKAKTLALTASVGEYEKVLRKSLQDLMKQLVPEITEAIG